MYGFNLGEIQGLTSDIPVINVSIKRGEVSYNYTFTYSDGDEAWVLENVGMVYDADGSFYLTTADFNESDVGDEYTINLSLPEAPTQAFTEAVKMATAVIDLYDMPSEIYGLIYTGATPYVADIITANGKMCKVPEITILRTDVSDTNEFDTYANLIEDVATNKEKNAFTEGWYPIDTKHYDGTNSTVGFTIPHIVMGEYTFMMKYEITYYPDEETPYLSVNLYVSLIEVLS